MENTEKLQVLIIGSGPAGYTAGIYASRADLSPVLYTGLQAGGQLTQTTEVENFPGFPTGIDGNMLMSQMEEQCRRLGTDIRFGVVTKITLGQEKGAWHEVEIDGEKTIMARTIIMATGASARWLGIPTEEKYKGYGVSACATCDGFFYRGKTVCVVGAGDSALEEATYLAKLCSKVYLIVRRDQMRASKAMQSRVLSTQNIEIIWNSQITEIYGNDGVEGVKVHNKVDNTDTDIALDGVFVAIGHHPNTELIAGQVELNGEGYIVTHDNTTHTNVPGVFAAGDVADPRYRQAIAAAAGGCRAAMDAERYINEL
ncbi:MAG: thioredoxin-disulfide reductase [Flavobacteriales bacterium]|jgi:thioredoxin reductase (NADPH)|nr:thioredoxin-disulfide reductase [Flavobacteriales bacterium]